MKDNAWEDLLSQIVGSQVQQGGPGQLPMQGGTPRETPSLDMAPTPTPSPDAPGGAAGKHGIDLSALQGLGDTALGGVEGGGDTEAKWQDLLKQMGRK